MRFSSRHFILLVSALATGVLARCSPHAPIPKCVPGMSSTCACANGSSGAQVCSSDGTFGACQCTGSADSGAHVVEDAGHDGGSRETDAGADGGDRADAGHDGGAGLPLGSSCSSASACASGSCVVAVDGGRVCCDQSACQLCQACNGSGVGCGAQPAGADYSDECELDAGACRAGVCNGAGACMASPAGTRCFESCATAQCFGQCAMATLTYSECDGTTIGSCPSAAVSAQCPGNLSCASAGGCRAACSIDAECRQGSYCDGGQCVARLPNGQPCWSHNMCTSRLCAGWGGFPVCSECLTTDDCRMSASACINGRCMGCSSNNDCIGWGQGICTFSPSGSYCAQCLTNNTAGCGRARAPICTQGACGCGRNEGVCPTGQICTGFGDNDVCRWRRGEPCVQGTDCASGFCDAGWCG